jgi:PIN domain nuclease of toxin-antitoxin system
VTVVLDASALLAYLLQEPGAEVVQKALSAGVDVEGMRAGQLWPHTRQQGLSLGDRACLSLGLRLGLTVVTCDRAWAQLPLELEVQVVRCDPTGPAG